MELKDYQQHCLNEVKAYLGHLAKVKAKYDRDVAEDPDYAFDFPQQAWGKAKDTKTFQGTIYRSKRNGLGDRLSIITKSAGFACASARIALLSPPRALALPVRQHVSPLASARSPSLSTNAIAPRGRSPYRATRA
jgi:hypothetical protein